MNNEQLQDWLTEVNLKCANALPELSERLNSNNNTNGSTSTGGGGTARRAPPDTAGAWRRLLKVEEGRTLLLMNYFVTNHHDVNLTQPLLAQLLALYYKLGPGRLFTYQLLPTLITCYLLSDSARQRLVSAVFEHYLLAVYNEEILAAGPAAQSMAKRVDEVRIPAVRQCPSVYHDPAKLIPSEPQPPPDPSRRGVGEGGVHCTVRIGPYSAVERMNCENRFLVLTRLVNAMNGVVSQLPSLVVCRSLCLSLLKLCRSGFAFPESDFRQRVLKEHASDEVIGSRDYAKKRRVALAPHFLVECLNTVNFALFNGHPDLALRALDAVHHRAQYELFPDVLLQTNALRNSLMDAQTVRGLLEGWETMGTIE